MEDGNFAGDSGVSGDDSNAPGLGSGRSMNDLQLFPFCDVILLLLLLILLVLSISYAASLSMLLKLVGRRVEGGDGIAPVLLLRETRPADVEEGGRAS